MLTCVISLCAILCLPGCSYRDAVRQTAKRQIEQTVQMYKRNWHVFRSDSRFSQLTITEYAHYSRCEAVFYGADILKSAQMIIKPAEASNWTIAGENRSSGEITIMFSYNSTNINIKLNY